MRSASRRVGPSGRDPPHGASPAVHVQHDLDADDTGTLQARPHVLAERVQAVPPLVASPASSFNCIGNQPAHTLPAMSASKRRLSEIVRTPAGPPSSPSTCAATGHPIMPVQHAFAAAPTGAPATDKDMPPGAPLRQLAYSGARNSPNSPPREERRPATPVPHWTFLNDTDLPSPEPLQPWPSTPAWYNSPDTGATTPSGTQRASTCGLHAFNHALAAASLSRNRPFHAVPQSRFEQTARSARVGDGMANLLEPGTGNYDVAVLSANFSGVGLAMIPLTPSDIELRLNAAFASHTTPEGLFTVPAYLFRGPMHGGHWFVVAAPGVHSDTSSSVVCPVLCDSIYPRPHLVSMSDFDSILAIWASKLAWASSGDVHCEWRCFLVGQQQAEDM